MEQKIYSAKELNEILNYNDISGHNSGKEALITRCCNAGLKIKDIPTKRGLPNKYIIVEDNFHIKGEVWKICYCNSEWEVSNLGRIRRISTKKLMGSSNLSDGYIRVCMTDPKTGKTVNKSLNRLVFFSFYPNFIPEESMFQIDHINGIRTDNRLENLRPLSNIKNTEMRDENQSKIKTLTTELILKFGYKKTEEKLKKLLEESP